MEELLRTYRSPILRNFEIKSVLNTILPSHIPDYFKKLRAITDTGNSWEKISRVLDTNMVEFPESDKAIESMLFEKLFFEVQDHVHLYHFESEIDADEFVSRFEDEVYINRPLNAIVLPNEKVISMRKDGNTILFLYRFETIKLGGDEQNANFYVPFLLDFENSILQIRLRKHYLSKSSANHIALLDELKNFINNLDGDLSISEYNESTVHSLLYNIFKEESENAEEIIKQHMKDHLTEGEIDRKILTFLKDELYMEEPELYSERVKSAYYQDLSLHLNPTEFYNGFIFAFTFLDKNFIRSSTRNPKRDPIYNSKVYWNLKDLIHEYEEVSELSCFWKFEEEDFEKVPEGEDFLFVEVSLRERYGSIEIHYYNSPSEKRRVKEKYVHSRIGKYLL
ncbi:hypothetical protein [Ureibacillus sinduriensis]|uniref:Uncharacterized protein n=1 Tax=Ureibacillus sinduriensis BLB-1 = JCM 15800 TaxID=1384057 RepID=A0A0A3HR42_9BACL|nr:hypothetical protein [Ureibacillus sinduriensis]KGR75076.1 hypothetical protein CD33_12415 [Ureibacillus sinduriensis BLB-1 = JCM 15800]